MKRIALFGALVLFSTAAAEEKGAIWAQHRGNAGATGMSVDVAVKPPLRLVWSYRCDSDTSGDAGAGITIGGGKVFCNMEMTRSILALDAETGAFCWEFTNPNVHYQQTSSYADGRLFVWLRGYGRSTLLALNAHTGKTIWEKKLGSTKGVMARRAGPALAPGKVLVADGDGVSAPSIICFETGAGKELWRHTLDMKAGAQIAAPTLAGETVFTGAKVGFRPGEAEPIHGAAIALDLRDGKELWRNADVVPTAPLVSDGKLVVTKFNGQPGLPKGKQKVSVLDAATGKELWSVPIWIAYGDVTLTPNLVIVKYYGAHMEAYERSTGKKTWESRFGGGSGCSSPSISGDYAFVGTGSFNDSEGFWAWRFTQPPHHYKNADGAVWSFHALDLKTGNSAWHCVTGNNVCGDPALAYGKVYLNSRDGRIYCYEPVKPNENPIANSPDLTPPADAESVRRLLRENLAAPRPGLDWPTEGGTNERAGMARGKLALPLAKTWTLDTGGRIVSAPVVNAGKAYVGSLSGKILCADLVSGAVRWEFKTGGEIHAAAAVTEGIVYCGASDGVMYALDADTAALKWSYRCGGPIQCAPAIVGGVLFFGANDHHFYALDRRTGKKLWSFKTSHPLVTTTPVVKGDTVYMAQWVDWVYALDAATGTEKWRDCVPISIEKLHYYGDKLYLRSARQICEYDPASGRRLRLANAVYGHNGLTFVKNLLFTTGTGLTSVLNLNEAGALSRYQDQPAIKDVLILQNRGIPAATRLASAGSPVAINDLVCFATARGELILIEPDLTTADSRTVNHKTIWAANLGATCHGTPVFADGCLLIGCDDGKLHAFSSK